MQYLIFFFQAEDGIRDVAVTGVQTCALPISSTASMPRSDRSRSAPAPVDPPPMTTTPVVVSGIQQKGERTAAALSPHPTGLFRPSCPLRPVPWPAPSRPNAASVAPPSSNPPVLP